MNSNKQSHLLPILQALLVTFLWSTSFIIIKWGLIEIPPITFAGLRYSLAFICFIPLVLRKKYFTEIKNLTGKQWLQLILLGIIFYTFTQGTQFLGLSLLPSVTVSLMLNFTPLLVAILGVFMINEKPTVLQWFGGALFIIGIFTYFSPLSSIQGQLTGLVVMIVGVIANAVASILGRNINRSKNISPLVVTFISMGIGAALLLLIGIGQSGIPNISYKNWLFIIWLAVINTALAFTLWNHTLRSLSAMESSIINGTMLIQIAILAWIFLGESITMINGVGMLIASIGAILVQLKPTTKH